MKRITAAGAAALALAIAGCKPAVEDTYRLAATQHGALPLRLNAPDKQCLHVLLGGDVHMTGSKYTSSFNIEKVCPGKGIEKVPVTGKGKFQVRGDSVLFQDSVKQIIGRGVRQGDSLIVTNDLYRLAYIRER